MASRAATAPAPLALPLTFALLLAILGPGTAGCAPAIPDSRIYKLYPGPRLPISEIAVVDCYWSTWIDGLRAEPTDWQRVHLHPGRHEFRWRMLQWGDSPLLTAELQAGRRYILLAGWGRSELVGEERRACFWIEDLESRAVVAGERP